MSTPALVGKVAIVSGASRGVGRTYALSLARAGARVLALGRTAGALAAVAAAADAAGLDVRVSAADVRDEAAIDAAVAHVRSIFGGVDILVNNAVAPIRPFGMMDVPAQEWADAFATNVRAPYAFIRAVVPLMREAGGGAIVNITSAAAQPSALGSGAHGYPAYAVTKAALDRLTTYVAAEVAADGIAVNALSPGHVAYYTRAGREPDERFWGSPLVHLASQRAGDGITGTILHTYQYGRSWGPRPAVEPAWDADIRTMLREAGLSA